MLPRVANNIIITAYVNSNHDAIIIVSIYKYSYNPAVLLEAVQR